MLRKKGMGEHALTSLNIDTDEDAIPSSLLSSEPSSPTHHSPPQSTTTNLPLLTTAYLSALTTGATTYAFSFYSSALKLSLRLSQSQLDTLSSATFCAGVLSWIPGMIVDRYGSKVGIVAGGMGNVCNLSFYWVIATGRVWDLSGDEDVTAWLIVVLSALGVLIFMGCALITGSVFKLIVESCGKGSKGKAVGCAKGYVGVGSGVYVCLFRAMFGGSSSAGGAGGPAKTALMSSEHGSSILASMSRAALLPSSALLSTITTSSATYHPLSIQSYRTDSSLLQTSSNNPPNPELMNTLNFLLMASCLSFLAAVIPALLLLPRHDKTQSKKPRDGTRSIHFRVIYAGLILLGMWVVGESLAELREEEEKAAAAAKRKMDGGAAGVPSTISNKTLDFGLFESSDVNDEYNQRMWDVNPLDAQILESKSTSRKNNEDGANQQQTTTGLNDPKDTPMINIENQSATSFSSSASERIRCLSPSAPERHWGTAILLLFLWWGPALSLLVIPPRKEPSAEYSTLNQEEEDGGDADDESSNDQVENDGQDVFVDDSAPNRRAMSLTKSGEGENDSTNSSPWKEFTLMEMLRTGRAWLMAWTFLIIVGGGTLMTCNIGQMTESLGFDSDLTPASLALFSAAQGASRVITGSISESALTWNVPIFCSCFGGNRGVARPAFLVLASFVSVAAHLTLAVASTQRGFAFGVTLSGIAFGMIWPLMVLITGEVFGTLHVGANYMFFDGFSSAMGTLLLSKFVAQTVYDEHIIESQGDPLDVDNNFQCFGKECFQMSHVVVCLLSFTCVISSFGVLRATRDVYRQ